MGDARTSPESAPRFSIVTVSFNAERYIADAIASILEQDYAGLELIIIDGGSSDGTCDIVRAFEPHLEGRLRLVSEPDEGPYHAMNKGIALSTGDIVGVLNSDDRYLPGALRLVAEAHRERPDAGAFYGDVEVIDANGVLLRTERASRLDGRGRRPDWMPMCHQSLFVTRATYRTLGGYDTHYRVLADYEFVLRCLAANVVFVQMEGPVAQFRIGGICNTDVARSAAEREAIRVRYGGNPLVERARRIRHAVNRTVYPLLTRGRARFADDEKGTVS